MAASTGTYRAWGPYARDILKGSIAVETSGRFKAALTTSSFSPNLDIDQYLSNISGELYGGLWPSGGVALSSVAVSLDTAGDRVSITHSNIVVDETTLVSPGVSAIVIYDDLSGVSAATKRLAFYASITPAIITAVQPISISSPNGIVRSSY